MKLLSSKVQYYYNIKRKNIYNKNKKINQILIQNKLNIKNKVKFKKKKEKQILVQKYNILIINKKRYKKFFKTKEKKFVL